MHSDQIGTQETDHIRLQTPDNVNLHVVFRQVLTKAPEIRMPEGYEGLFCAKPRALRGVRGALWGAWGGWEAAKALAKLCTRRRFLFLFVDKGTQELAAYGWAGIGMSRSYPVGKEEVVIGPIWTSPGARRRGLATAGLRLTLRSLFEKGFRVFFIDTRERNLGCVKAAQEAGFEPVAAHWRPPEEGRT